MSELVTFFEGAWPLFDILDMNFEDDLDSMLGLFSASLSFYPGIDALYRRRVVAASDARHDVAEQELKP